jgi:hypothetical protein
MILQVSSTALALRERNYIGRKGHNDGMPLRTYSVYEGVVGIDLHSRNYPQTSDRLLAMETHL